MKVALEPLPPADALAFFRQKGFAPPDARFDFRDVWREEHARSFVVAKAMRDDVLQTIRGELDRALAEGRTLAQFTEALEPELKRQGWWGESMARDPLTGEMRDVRLGSRRRLRVIFQSNMRAAHAAGQWARIQRAKGAFPFLRYWIDRIKGVRFGIPYLVVACESVACLPVFPSPSRLATVSDCERSSRPPGARRSTSGGRVLFF